MKFFLIGFMGSGKTYRGKQWARETGLRFYDLDAEIESKQGSSIAAIFEKKGEDYFRKIETDMLHSFSEKDDCIIACGGGTACFNHNIEWMAKNGVTVYLEASPAYILKKVINEKEQRPLISKLNEGEILFFIEQKLKERLPFYNRAAIKLPVEGLAVDFIPDFFHPDK
ncbi:MAG: shikimate kinase [Chitinophagaceae bacterium]|nr:shikimate kinase [Chitinophagaceae bacterium]